MRTVVTGGAGFIGSRVAADHVAHGHPTLVIDDLSGGEASAVPPGARFEVFDVRDPRIVDRVAAFRPDLVVHAAGQVSVARSVADPDVDWAINVVGTRNVLAGAAAGGASRVVFLSSGGAIYGEADGAAETAEPRPQSPYGRSKLAAEELVARSGLPYAIARLANVYGPGQRSDLEGGVVAIFIERLLRDLPIDIHGDGRQRRDLVYVDDVVGAIDAMSLASGSGRWNVATGTAIEVRAILALLERLTGRTAIAKQAPRRAGDVGVSRLAIELIAQDLAWRPRHDLLTGLTAMLDVVPGGAALAPR